MTIDISELRRLALDGDLAAMQEIILRLKAAEKSDAESLAMYRKARDERDALRAEIEELHVLIAAVKKRADAEFRLRVKKEEEYTRLRAKVAEMEKQEPVRHEFQGRDGDWYPFINQRHYENTVADGTWPIRALYAIPGAQGLASSQDEWKTLAKDLLREIERQTCAHEETHRGGFLWEICDACGAKWADDEGGKPEFKWPKVVEKARAMLEADPGAKGDEK